MKLNELKYRDELQKIYKELLLQNSNVEDLRDTLNELFDETIDEVLIENTEV